MAEYIGRDAVMRKFAEHVRRSNNSDFAPVPTWNEAVQIVEDFPAADVRPVAKARWKCVSIGRYACSYCGDEPYYSGDIHTLRFCPNCGADMREES